MTRKRKFLNWTLKPLMLSRYGKKIRKIFPQLYPWCKMFPRTIVILSDGHVTTCCNDAYGENIFGSIYKNNLTEIWRNQVFGDLYDYKKCRKCLGGFNTSLRSNGIDYLDYKYPEVVYLEITAKCNYNCCLSNEMYKYRENGKTELDLDKTFEKIKSMLGKIQQLYLFNYGESLLHSGFCDFVKKIRKEFDTLYLLLSTNGILMDEKISRCLIEQRLDTVCISIHGGPGTENMLKYSKYGADYEKVLANIKQLINLRKMYKSKLPKVEIKTILFNWNDTDELMERLRKDAKAVGADRVFWALDWETGELPTSSKRFTLGSEEVKKLKRRAEFMVY